jgi:hypothetical protein
LLSSNPPNPSVEKICDSNVANVSPMHLGQTTVSSHIDELLAMEEFKRLFRDYKEDIVGDREVVRNVLGEMDYRD